MKFIILFLQKHLPQNRESVTLNKLDHTYGSVSGSYVRVGLRVCVCVPLITIRTD